MIGALHAAADRQAQTFFATAMTAPQLVDTSAGRAALFTAPSPERHGDNEDSAALISVAPGVCVLAVADGAGGQPAGAQASRLALERLVAAVRGAEPDRLRLAILDGIESANETILAQGVGSATTLVAVEIHAATVRTYHVGDSLGLVVGQRGRIKLLTIAHSPVGYAVESGLMDEAEAMHHAERHVVSNLVGMPDMRIEVGPTVQLAPRDTVLLGSDGLFDNLQIDEIVDLVRKGPLDNVATTLLKACRKRMRRSEGDAPSKPDDLTFVLHRRS